MLTVSRDLLHRRVVALSSWQPAPSSRYGIGCSPPTPAGRSMGAIRPCGLGRFRTLTTAELLT